MRFWCNDTYHHLFLVSPKRARLRTEVLCTYKSMYTTLRASLTDGLQQYFIILFVFSVLVQVQGTSGPISSRL